MEFVEKGELWEVAKNFGIVSEQLYKYYAAHIVKAVWVVHEKYTIVHRDLKPDNILISESN